MQRTLNERGPAQTRGNPQPPVPAHLTAVRINMPPLLNHTLIVPPIIERYPTMLKWAGAALVVPGVLLYNKGYPVPGIALIGAALGMGILSALVRTFANDPASRFHIIEMD